MVITCTYISNHNCQVYTGDADVLYNKFNVDYNMESPEVPDNPPLYPDDYYCAVATDKNWKVFKCTEKRQVVCQGGLTIVIYTMSIIINCVQHWAYSETVPRPGASPSPVSYKGPQIREMQTDFRRFSAVYNGFFYQNGGQNYFRFRFSF